VPPEQELTEALLSLSWPLPRTVEDADAALTRLEEVKAVLTRLEQQSVGNEAWWAGQVDGLATQSGFVLEWWRPVLRDPDLDWTLNHQAHLTADLATLASAGARLLDQIEPRAAEEAAAAMHARRVAQEKRWGPAAVPPFAPTGPKPQPPGRVFGDPAEQIPGQGQGSAPEQGQGQQQEQYADLNAPVFPPIPPPPVPPQQTQPPQPPQQRQPPQPRTAEPAYDAPPVAAPPTQQQPEQEEDPGAEAEEPLPTSARHRRPAYDFDDPAHGVPPMPPPAAFPAPAGPVPRSPLVPGPGFGGPPQGRTLAPGNYPPQPQGQGLQQGPPRGFGPGPGGPHGPSPSQGPILARPATGTAAFGFVGEDDDDDDSEGMVPSGLALRRHQRRLLIQTGAILGAIGVLCWWAVYTLSSSPSHTSAAGDASTHTTEAGKSSPATGSGGTAAGGLTNPNASPTSSGTSKGSGAPSSSASPGDAPSTVHSSAPDATTVSSVRVTLLGGSTNVPQIVALITVDTAGTGQVTVTGSYYGASGSKHVNAEMEQWALSGKTTYQYSVPIANSPYCGTEFHFTVSAGGHSESEDTSPGC
jgi:hypothetical protein